MTEFKSIHSDGVLYGHSRCPVPIQRAKAIYWWIAICMDNKHCQSYVTPHHNSLYWYLKLFSFIAVSQSPDSMLMGIRLFMAKMHEYGRGCNKSANSVITPEICVRNVGCNYDVQRTFVSI